MADVTFWPAMTIIVPSFFTLIMTIVVAWMGQRNKKAVETASAVATTAAESASAEAVKVSQSLKMNTAATDVKLADLKVVTSDVLIHVNSGMEKVLRVAAVALRRVADMSRDPKDAAAAVVAEQQLADHMKAQVKIDKAADKRETVATVAATTIGEAVGEVSTDVKIVKEDVKILKEAAEEDKPKEKP